MIDYKKLLELKKRGLSNNAISHTLGCKWDTVRRVITRCENYWGALEDVPEDLTNLQLADAILSKHFQSNEDYLLPDSEIILEKQRKGKQRNQLWLEYVAEATSKGKKAYKISQFNKIVTKFQITNDISYSVEHEPGVEGQVDWCGDKGFFVDPRTNKVKDVVIFVCTLPYSGYFYAEGFLDMTMKNWIEAHINAFAVFGGSPCVLTPDNCSTAVNIRKSWWDDAILNTQYCAFADHYGITLKPARVLAPDDKGSVERHVGIIESDILPQMKEITCYSLEEFNRILWKKVQARLERKLTKNDFSRKAIFLNEEQATLLPLPTINYENYVEKTAIVGRDFHIQFDSAFYSVPVNYIKSKVTVRATNNKVRIYDSKRVLIAEHNRATHRWQRCTDPKHVPEGHTPSIAYSRRAFINKASSYGEELVCWVEAVLNRFEFEVQGYRPVNTVLCNLKNYSKETVLEAARFANTTGIYSSRGFLECCKQLKTKKVITAPKHDSMDLNAIFCSHPKEEEKA